MEKSSMKHMKIIRYLLLFVITALLALCAQVQHGYVKTKGVLQTGGSVTPIYTQTSGQHLCHARKL